MVFRQQIEDFLDSGVLTKFLFSCSRPSHPPGAGCQRYVQDNVRCHASQMFRLIDKEEAVVFVCGDANHMAKDVMNAFVDIVMSLQGRCSYKMCTVVCEGGMNFLLIIVLITVVYNVYRAIA